MVSKPKKSLGLTNDAPAHVEAKPNPPHARSRVPSKADKVNLIGHAKISNLFSGSRASSEAVSISGKFESRHFREMVHACLVP